MKLEINKDREIILFLIGIYFVLFICFLLFTFSFKIPKYITINGVVVKDNLVEVLVNDSYKKVINSNSYIFLDNKKYKYKVGDVILNAYRKDNKNYHVFYIKCNTLDYMENDTILLIFRKNNIKVFRLFETIWKGEVSEEFK